MNLFHRHNYVEVVRTFAPPIGLPKTVWVYSRAEERAIHGVTTILRRCECGTETLTEMLGRETADALERMVR